MTSNTRQYPPLLSGKRPCQFAYYVPDVREAAQRHHELHGSGPFFVAEHIEFPICRYRGEDSEWDQSSSFGYWGDIMVEFMVQNRPGPSVIEDVQAVNKAVSGLHHLAFYLENPHDALVRFNAMGHETALYATLTNGVEVFMVDTIERYGHMIEFYEPSADLMEIHDFIRQASLDFDGDRPVRDFAI